MKRFLYVLLVFLLVAPVVATTEYAIVNPEDWGAVENPLSGIFLYNQTMQRTPESYSIPHAATRFIYSSGYVYWVHSVDHTAEYVATYNGVDYFNVSVVATFNGYNSATNRTIAPSVDYIGADMKLDFTFSNFNPALKGLTPYDTPLNSTTIYDNITKYLDTWSVIEIVASNQPATNVSDVIGLGKLQYIGGVLPMAHDGVHSFTYSGAAPPPSGNSTLSGYTNNAYTGAPLSGVVVAAAQGTSTAYDTSIASGHYSVTLIDGVLAAISALKTGYTANPPSFSFTPANSTDYTSNISMMPAFVPNSTAIIGVVYRSWDGAPVQGATVTLANGSWSGPYTSTMTGFYIFDHLPAGETYTVSASAAGYSASAGYSVTTSSGITVEQDIPLSAQYTVTLTAVDGSTGLIIQGTPVFFQSSDGQTANTTLGTTTFVVTGGYLTFTASAEGYSVGQQSASVTGDTSLTLLLYKSSESTGVQISVPPHHVKFIVRNQNGLPLDNVLVTAQGEETTVGSWDWLLSIFGIGGWVSTPIHNTSMTGYTDSRGEIDFLMFPEIKYNMSFIKSGFINNRTYLYPHYDEYSIVVPSALWFVNGSDVNRYINWSITRTLNSDTDATITVRYNDTLSHTSKIIMDLRKADNAQSMSRTPIANCSWTGAGGSSLACSFHVADYKLPANNSYYLNGTSLSQDFGRVQRDFGITFPLQEPLSGFKLPDLVLFLISALILFCVGMLFGATSTAQGSLVVCIVAWVFWLMGMMDYVVNMNPTGFFIGLGLATVTAVFANFTVAQRQEGYP